MMYPRVRRLAYEMHRIKTQMDDVAGDVAVCSVARVGACGHAGRRFFAGFSPVDSSGCALHDGMKEKIQQAQSLMVSYCRTSCFVVVMVVLTISILVLPLVLPPLPPPPLVLLFVPLMILSLLVLLALRSSQMPNMDTAAAV
ncbi:hypothetical protein NC651_015092 [Populus alba x Populus x berolinensis]|nr:hypothetical protein NC651_015092 [Populus alba x Populus x berolinensis]